MLNQTFTVVRATLLAGAWAVACSVPAHASVYATPVCLRAQGCIAFAPDATSTVATTATAWFYSGFPANGVLAKQVTTVSGNTVQISATYTEGPGFPDPGPPPYTRQFALPLLAPGQYTLVLNISPDPSYPNPPPVTTPSGPVAAGVSMSAGFAVIYTQLGPITPQVGLWWNPNESGSGYSLDVKHDVLVVTVYSYTAPGPPIWYLAFGPIDSNNTVTATLFKYANGQCISCVYVAPIDNGDDGTVTIKFTSPTSATMTLPGRAPFTITPQDF